MNTKSIDPSAFKPMKVTASKDIEVGFEIEPIIKKLTLDKMRLYRSQWPRIRSWHNDYEVAQKWGVDKPIAFASQVMEYIGEMLVKFFGEGYIGGNLSVSIIQPVLPEDTITTRGIVREKVVEGKTVRLILEVWCENQNGDKVLVGKASGLVR
jgi:3-hydroxybutyryl-CoA dehydratase